MKLSGGCEIFRINLNSLETSFETSFISALKNIQKNSDMMTKHKKTLISSRKKKTKINDKNLIANCNAVSNFILL